MSLIGNAAAIVQIRRQMQTLRGPATRKRLAKAMGNAALKSLQDGFRNGKDPYGAPWKPLARNRKRNRKRGGTSKPLLDTGRLRRSFALNVDTNGFSLWSKTKYAGYHQFGTRGRSKDSTRFQAVTKKGRFRKHSSGAKLKSIRVRALSFKAGGGAIPQRAMVPIKGRGLGEWKWRMQNAARNVMLQVFQRII